MKFGDKVKVFPEEDVARVGFFLHEGPGDKDTVQLGERTVQVAYRGEDDAKKDGSGLTYREV